MTEQFPELRIDALKVMREAWREAAGRDVKTFVLFSGGNDSTVLAHWAKPYASGLVHIDTGTALPGVREFVESFAKRYDMPLRIYEAGDAFERMVLGEGDRQGPRRAHGFPGPQGHRYAYIRLKERQIAQLVREVKTHHTDRVVLLTGVRRAESVRRMGTAKPVHRDGATVWASPLIDWSNEDMRDYRRKFNLPQSDIAALIHRSGECNCGAFAAPGEREMLFDLFPEFKAKIEGMEAKAREMGLEHCRWGEKPAERVDSPGPMCGQCQVAFDLEEAA